MADTSLVAKLRIAPGGRVWVSDRSQVTLLGGLPDGAMVVDAPDGATVAIAFTPDAAVVRATLAEHAGALGAVGAFWVAYPKGNAADINRDSLWPILAEHGFRPIGQVAIDATWSALRFRPLTAGEAPFTGGR